MYYACRSTYKYAILCEKGHNASTKSITPDKPVQADQR